MAKNNFLLRVWEKLKQITLWFFVLHLLYIIVLRWVNPPITITQLTNWIEGHGLKRDYVDFDAMSPNIRLAVMASEDQLFPDHNGFDIKSIKKALESNKKSKRVRGASTISQQVAKNVFLWQGRSWFRKGLEVYFTFMIELLWSKERILEMYLNVSEMGTGIFGVEAAAQKYFKKPASKLTRTEAARIAAVLPNPKKYKAEPASPYVARRTSWILNQMNNLQGDEGVAKLLEVPKPDKKSKKK
ncbi:MAG TPA: monofunctional biosynthetic peptidoglycan transglycosylase [Cyclobacteriaceae bacterium]|nr:monofunctional biosynthetic peptidoglycan transglycosylase [Cyclobacteriaceae bacterium]